MLGRVLILITLFVLTHLICKGSYEVDTYENTHFNDAVKSFLFERGAVQYTHSLWSSQSLIL